MTGAIILALGIAAAEPSTVLGGGYDALNTARGDPSSEEMLFTYLMNAVRECETRRARTIAQLKTAESWSAWGSRARTELCRAVGAFPEKTPLNPQVLGVLRRDGYWIEKVIYQSRPRFFVTANLYVPEDGESRHPAVLSPCGHTDNGKADETFQHVYISLAKLGFVVLAYDPVGQGERNEYWDIAANKPILRPGVMQHCQVGNQCYLTGTNLAQYRIWDGIRSVDYLCSRSEVDPKRIGVTGTSGGGNFTLYLSAVDDRLTAAVPSCFITSLPRRVASRVTADAEQNLVGQFPNMLDHADVLIAFAPRPLMIASVTQDFFPIEGTRETFETVKHAYEALGVPEKAAMTEVDDKHGWPIELRSATYRWFCRWLKGDETPVDEPSNIRVEPEKNLLCTPEGQVAYRGSKTVCDFNLAYATSIRPSRDPAAILSNLYQWKEDIRLAALDALNMPDNWYQRGELQSVETAESEGISIEKLYVKTEPGIVVPCLLFKRPDARNEMPLIVCIDERGKNAEAAPGGLYRRLAAAGCAVLAVDPRGIGETMSRMKSNDYYGFYGIETDLTYTSFMLGRPLLGMRVYDVVRTIAAVRDRNGIRPGRILCVGTGSAAPIALFAAAIDNSLGGAVYRKGPLSYFSIVETRFHQWHVNCFVPDIVRRFDLPDLAALVSPRAMFVLEPLDGAKKAVPDADALKPYETAQIVCRQAGKPENFVLRTSVSDDDVVQLLRSWYLRVI